MRSPDRDDPLPDEDYELLEDETRVRRYLYEGPDQPTEVDQVEEVEEEPYLDEEGFYVGDPEELDGDEGELYYEEDAPELAGEPYEPDDPTEVLAGDDFYDEPDGDQVDLAYYEPEPPGPGELEVDHPDEDLAYSVERGPIAPEDRTAGPTRQRIAGGDRPLAEQARLLAAAARAGTLSAELGLPPRTGARLLGLGAVVLVVGLMLALVSTAVSGPSDVDLAAERAADADDAKRAADDRRSEQLALARERASALRERRARDARAERQRLAELRRERRAARRRAARARSARRRADAPAPSPPELAPPRSAGGRAPRSTPAPRTPAPSGPPRSGGGGGSRGGGSGGGGGGSGGGGGEFGIE